MKHIDMPLNITLKIGSSQYPVLQFRYGFDRKVNPNGMPLGGMAGGDLLLKMESTKSTELLDMMVNHDPDCPARHPARAISGSIEIYDEEEQTVVRNIVFEEAYIYSFNESMKSHGAVPMTQTIAISPLRLDINGTIRLDRRFPQTYGFWWEEYKPEEQPVMANNEDNTLQPTIHEIKWGDMKIGEEIDSILSDTWAGLSVGLENFSGKEELTFTIKEKSGWPIDGENSEMTFTEKAGKDATLEVKKAFKFDDGADSAREVEVTVEYGDQKVSGNHSLQERNGGIWGLSKTDALKVANDIKFVFSAARFSKFTALISLDSGDSKHIAYIPQSDVKTLFGDITMSSDDKLAIEMVCNTINSNSKHLVSFGMKSDVPTPSQKKTFPPRYPELAQLENFTLQLLRPDGSSTEKTEYGSMSLIINDDVHPQDYHKYSTSTDGNIIKAEVPNPAGSSIITLHEIIGHGRSLSLGGRESSQHEDAILFENLLLRIMGYQDIQRDGTDHLTRIEIHNPSRLPEFR